MIVMRVCMQACVCNSSRAGGESGVMELKRVRGGARMGDKGEVLHIKGEHIGRDRLDVIFTIDRQGMA